MIKAEFHSDDLKVEIDFDATPFFENASDDAIFALVECGWGGDDPADNVMYVMQDHGSDVFDKWCRYQEFYDGGFEIHVGEEDAMDWLQNNKPNVFAQLIMKTC